VIVLFLLFIVGCEKRPAGVSLGSVSKNGTHRITIIEVRSEPRYFEVRLERLSDGFKTNIFRSAAEASGFGTERIVWSDDHSQFVITSRNLTVNNPSVIPLEKMYLLYDVPTGKVSCNSMDGKYPAFTERDIRFWRGSYENDETRTWGEGVLPPFKTNRTRVDFKQR
jgi:hypothetical protein